MLVVLLAHFKLAQLCKATLFCTTLPAGPCRLSSPASLLTKCPVVSARRWQCVHRSFCTKAIIVDVLHRHCRHSWAQQTTQNAWNSLHHDSQQSCKHVPWSAALCDAEDGRKTSVHHQTIVSLTVRHRHVQDSLCLPHHPTGEREFPPRG